MNKKQSEPRRDGWRVLERALKSLAALDAEVVDRCPCEDCEACRPLLGVAA